MTKTLTIQDVPAKFLEILANLSEEDEIVIV